MVQIRKAKRADAPFIAQFQIDMALETEGMHLDPDTIRPGVDAVFGDEHTGTYYVAELDGKVIGSLMTTYEWSDWRNGTVLWIQSVYVDSKHRGKGAYRKLYEHIKQLVQNPDNDFRGIRLYVDKTNTSAQSVYARLGMHNHHYDMYEWMDE